jgi:hypothetical protein
MLMALDVFVHASTLCLTIPVILDLLHYTCLILKTTIFANRFIFSYIFWNY